jgi:hypothetical protein
MESITERNSTLALPPLQRAIKYKYRIAYLSVVVYINGEKNPIDLYSMPSPCR